MVEKDYGRFIDNDQYDRNQQHSVFDDDVMEDIDSVQEPYPVNDTYENEDSDNKEVENPDEKVHEYDDNDHPHEYRPPSAVIDNYKGSATGSGVTNDFEDQTPLQSTIPAFNHDR